MGTGWRRALCTSVQRDDRDEDAKAKKRRPHDASPRSFFFSNSNSNPTLRCRTKPPPESAPVTPPSAPAPRRKPRMPLLQALSAPSSPRSPSRFALLKASLLPSSKCRCGVCCRSVKSSGSSAVFTAECSHTFHFPCIASHARSSSGVLSCPVCASPWRQAPFLASLRLHCSSSLQDKPSGGLKVYDDDEPLVKVTAGNEFNPIPEDDDGEEFKGFLPSSSAAAAAAGGGVHGLLAVSVSPEVALVCSGRRHRKYVVALKVKAPGLLQRSSPRRAPIDLVTVLDVSQGMMGEKLQTLKRGMRLVVASLSPADRLSIVAFSGAAKRLLPLRRMTRQGQRSARQIVDRLVVCATAAAASSTSQGQQEGQCVGDALRKATKVLEDRRDRNPVATVMLLSDTQTHQQQQQQQQQQGVLRRGPSVTRFTHVEIPIVGDAPPPLTNPVEAFAKCLGGLVSVVMQEVHLQLMFPTGEITAVYSSTGPGGQQQATIVKTGGDVVNVRLGEMYAEEERELLLELRVPLTAVDHNHLGEMSVRCTYRDPASQETVQDAQQPPPLMLPNCSSSSHAKCKRLHDLFVATRAVAESRRLAELHDLATAIHLLSSARALLMQTSPPSQQQQELLASLDTELSDMRWRRTQQQPLTPTSRSAPRSRDDANTTRAGGEPLTPTSAWRAAEQLAKVAIMRKSMNRVSDLHGFENARF